MCQTGVIERDDIPFVLIVLYTGKKSSSCSLRSGRLYSKRQLPSQKKHCSLRSGRVYSKR